MTMIHIRQFQYNATTKFKKKKPICTLHLKKVRKKKEKTTDLHTNDEILFYLIYRSRGCVNDECQCV